jgi:hypothetical protein
VPAKELNQRGATAMSSTSSAGDKAPSANNGNPNI